MITPSAIFEQYCSPTSDGKLLCDITKVGRELALDIDEALAAIGEGGGQDVDEDSTNATTKQDIDTPFVRPSFGNSINNSVVDMNETMATIRTTTTTTESDSSSNVSSPEVFPLLLGSILIIATVVFTLITLATVYQRRRKSYHNNNNEQYVKSSSTVLPDSNSWVEEELSESSDEEDWPSSSEQKVLMSWNNLSCSYPTKNGDDNITLKDVTGHIKYKELVAIMGGSG